MSPDRLLDRAGLAAKGAAIPLPGGDMGDVWRIGPYVVKTHSSAAPGQFRAEADGLVALSDSGCQTPEVHYADDDGIVLTYLPSAAPNWSDLARQLAHVHSQEVRHYGWHGRVFLGRAALPSGRTTSEWRTFWGQERILPLVTLCGSKLGPLRKRVTELLSRFEPPCEGPTLIHGDLWSGNFLMSEDGAFLIDPSVWWGERAVDLSMMQLFGGFPERFWSAYEEALPIPREVKAALPYYQLYYLLVHVHFFGTSYCAQIDRILSHYGA